MRFQRNGTKHAAGSVIEMSTRGEGGWQGIGGGAADDSDLEAASPPPPRRHRSSSKANPNANSRACPAPAPPAATYGSPGYLGPYTAHATLMPDHGQVPRSGRQRANQQQQQQPQQSMTTRRGIGGGGVIRRDMICGVRRQMFWVIIATGTFALIATIGVGVGLGVALRETASPSEKG